ncbi:MAG TPA: amidohydrolase family protein, partial [Desulfosarcina sp.]|nr:amidohydrolase family protein [Desulfosarcina sp.]
MTSITKDVYSIQEKIDGFPEGTRVSPHLTELGGCVYDILLKNARVIDGTGQPPTAADLAVDGGRIAAVGGLSGAEARTVLDCRGKVVTPGFIDMHSHADFSLPVLPSADSLLHQGITTAVIGQCGLSPAPLIAETRGEVVSALGGFFAEVGRLMPWERWAGFGEYLEFL